MIGFFAAATVLSFLKRAALWILRNAFPGLFDDSQTSTSVPAVTEVKPPLDPHTAVLDVPQTVQAADAETATVAAAGIAVIDAEHAKTTEELAAKQAEIGRATLEELAIAMNTGYPVRSRSSKPEN